jgi:amino-acid N-acetyltransferase
MPEPLMIRGRPLRSAAVALLAAEGLPVADLTDAHLEHFFCAGFDGSPTALVGLEIYGTDALLRSLVVGADARTKGLGSALVRHAEHYAAARHVQAIYLLTTTAEAFFERLGYRRRRSDASAAVNPIHARVFKPLSGELGIHDQTARSREVTYETTPGAPKARPSRRVRRLAATPRARRAGSKIRKASNGRRS